MKRLIIWAGILWASPAHGQNNGFYHDNPAIHGCAAVLDHYSRWAVDSRLYLHKQSSDFGGTIDATTLFDIENIGFVEGLTFVRTNINAIQRRGNLGGEPSVADCEEVERSAQEQIESYARTLLRDVDPADRGRRLAEATRFRMGLQQSSRRFQGY